ncbi:MAG: hypothetical protein AVDCRST_MAG11-2994, partial [uncultured Gemmatimonadaceae bacterium]
ARRAAQRHLPADGDQRLARQRDTRRGERSRRPHRRGGDHPEQPEQRGAVRPLAGREQERDAGEADGDREDAAPRDGLAGEAAQQDHPQRDGGDEQRGEARGHLLLGDRHDPVGAHQQRADERRAEQGRAIDPHVVAARREHREQDRAGHREARAGRQERRHGLDHHADREV